MTFWPRPSLARRVVLTLLAAFVLVWLALLGKELATFKAETGQLTAMRQAAVALAASLPAQDPTLARGIVAAQEMLINQLRRSSPMPDPGDVLLQLDTAAGVTVYASTALRGQPMRADTRPNQVTVGARSYWTVTHTTPNWHVRLLEPSVTDAHMLSLIGADLLTYLLIAFPLVLLPVWLAVRQGLRPLRALGGQVATRAADDLSPLRAVPDYAELRPLVEAYNALLERARHSIERERALVQDAAHELRTPLAVVATQAHVLANANDTAQRAAALAALEQAVARAAHLAQQLLTLAALENTGNRAATECDLVETARTILIAFSPAAAAKDIELSLDSPELLPASLDVAAFHSVLENLLANAVAYCPNGARVQVTLGEAAGRMQLKVADDGPGIPADERNQIFERFRRGRTATRSGSGLGLAIARQAAHRLGGEIRLESGLTDRSACFSVNWPIDPR
jgi:two-component system, OmpR family, sensor histidine kinase QseC